MKDKEVIETLNDMKGVFGKRGHSQYSLYSIDRAIAAIEKQLPKTPMQNFYNEGDYTWECVNCEETVDEGQNYCHNCGQKLVEWED